MIVTVITIKTLLVSNLMLAMVSHHYRMNTNTHLCVYGKQLQNAQKNFEKNALIEITATWPSKLLYKIQHV